MSDHPHAAPATALEHAASAAAARIVHHPRWPERAEEAHALATKIIVGAFEEAKARHRADPVSEATSSASDTPRTDAFLKAPKTAWDGMWIEFARGLEMENQNLRKLCADRPCQRLQAENEKLREVRAAVLAYERITDTEYALLCNAGDFNAEFTRLLRALHATMPNIKDEPRGS